MSTSTTVRASRYVHLSPRTALFGVAVALAVNTGCVREKALDDTTSDHDGRGLPLFVEAHIEGLEDDVIELDHGIAGWVGGELEVILTDAPLSCSTGDVVSSDRPYHRLRLTGKAMRGATWHGMYAECKDDGFQVVCDHQYRFWLRLDLHEEMDDGSPRWSTDGRWTWSEPDASGSIKFRVRRCDPL